tara:strand:- start:2325 stop:3122 length:798 start_codon:yes stop_codon:yes gene_type:complete
MTKDFKQIQVSTSLTHFKKGIKKKWDLNDYYDHKSPAIFFGIYNDLDLSNILNHDSYAIIIFGGNDLNSERILKIFNSKNKNRIFTFGYAWLNHFFQKYKIPYKEMILPIKDFSNLNPTKLGKNIYVYLGQPNNRRYNYFKFDEIIIPLIDNFGEKRVIWVKENYPITYKKLIKNYYNNSFVFIKPNERGGSTTMWELAHMGRKTIAQNQGGAPNVIEYKNLNHLIDLTYEESEKIGTIQEKVYSDIKNIFQESSNWLDLKFWLK